MDTDVFIFFETDDQFPEHVNVFILMATETNVVFLRRVFNVARKLTLLALTMMSGLML